MPDVITFREAHALDKIAGGMLPSEAFRQAGFGRFICEHPTAFIEANPGLKAELEKAREAAIFKIGFTAEHVLEELIRQYAGLIVQEARLEGMLGHDIGDLYSDSGALLGVRDWPDVWRKQLVVEIQTKEEFGRSNDGEDGEKRGGWDKAADVKNLKRESTLAIERELRACKKQQVEVLELMMTHKAVDAKVQQKQGDTHLHLHAEVNARLEGARRRESKIIDTTPE